MTRFKKLFGLFLPVLMLMSLLTGNVQAALLDFGPIVPEVVGSTPPNVGHGFPAWFRDSNRVPLQLCVEETPGCLFAAADRPNLNQPLAFPNLPDELFYYSATATIGTQLLFAGVEMNFFDNGDGTYEQVGFARVRIRVDSTVAGNYTVTTPWKQYFFTVDQATIDANAGLRVINATEDIGLGPDGVFTGVLLGSVDTFVYSQGAPFVTAAGSFLGTGAALPVEGSKFTDPVTGQPANIFRIEGPPGFTTVSTNQFAITGKLTPPADPIPTPLTVDKLTYVRDAAGVQVNAFATTQPVANPTVGGAAFPGRFALTGALSALQVSATGIPTQPMLTNSLADGNFFSTTTRFAFQGNLPTNATVTNTADAPDTLKTVPLVDEIKISGATYNKLTNTLTISAQSLDTVANPTLTAFMPGMTAPLGTLSNGLLSVSFPVNDTSGTTQKTFNIPPQTITVTSAIGGSTTVPVFTFLPVQPAPATGVTIASTVPSPQLPGPAVTFIASGSGGTGNYEYQFLLNTGGVWSIVQNYSTAATWTWNTNGLAPGPYGVQVNVRSAGSSAGTTITNFEAAKFIAYTLAAPPAPASAVALAPTLASPQTAGASITFVAAGSGGSGKYEYRFWRKTGAVWSVVQNYGTAATWTWNTTGAVPGTYGVQVDVRNVGSTTLPSEAAKAISYTIK